MLNKVPQLTINFWTIKIMATTEGETGAELLAVKIKLDLTIATEWEGVLVTMAVVGQRVCGGRRTGLS